jgi:exonuclease SbcD
MTRILHTSDWHLGATLETVSREPDHALFLQWLTSALEEHAIDVLAIAGDVFDQAQPSAEAQRAYYRFLHQIARKRVRTVVVVGGNHDSPSRLDAPRELLDELSVHVVGGLLGDPATWDRCLCPVKGPDGRVEAVLLAVPFVHEFRLGVRTATADPASIAAEFRDRFAALYTDLADRAEALAPGRPIVATGHLACAGAVREDAPADVHMIGTIGGLPADIFDPRIRYAALGHIHRSYHVGDSCAWYSGSPIALSSKEARSARKVLLVDVADDAGVPEVRPLEVPAPRPILELRGQLDEVGDRLRAMTWDTELPPFVYAFLETDYVGAGVEAELHKAAEANPHGTPRLLAVRRGLQRTAGVEPASAPTPPLSELEPEEVFLRLCAARGVEAEAELLDAFRIVAQSQDESSGGEP